MPERQALKKLMVAKKFSEKKNSMPFAKAAIRKELIQRLRSGKTDARTKKLVLALGLAKARREKMKGEARKKIGKALIGRAILKKRAKEALSERARSAVVRSAAKSRLKRGLTIGAIKAAKNRKNRQQRPIVHTSG